MIDCDSVGNPLHPFASILMLCVIYERYTSERRSSACLTTSYTKRCLLAVKMSSYVQVYALPMLMYVVAT